MSYISSAKMDGNIEIGVEFETLEEVEKAMSNFEKLQFVNYYISDSRKIATAAKNTPKVVEKARPELLYYFILYTCIHGGRKFKSKSNGLRPHQSTFKNECPAKIRFGLSGDGQKLIVKDLVKEHNHLNDINTFSHLPRQRHLDATEMNEASLLLSLKANKKIVQEHLQAKTGKVVLLRDLSNIRSSSRPQHENQLEAVVQLLDKEGATVQVTADQTGRLLSIFYQDANMKRFFARYPELLLIDATYKVNELRMPLYILMVVDGNGESEVVATFITADETHTTVQSMMQSFKAHNPDYINVKTIMSDKDFVERQVMREEFPQAALVICLFHVLRTFRREITCENMNIRAEQRDLCLRIIEEIVYSKSPAIYDEKVLALEAIGIQSVIDYFRRNWHGIREEFVECFKGQNITLGNRTNNRLESINEKIKSVCSRNGSLPEFYEELLVALNSLRTERTHRNILVSQKRPVSLYPPTSIEFSWLQVLTPYAFSLLEPHLKSYKRLQLESMSDIIVSENACTCIFHRSTLLPCKHIFASRLVHGFSLFEPSLAPERWTRRYYSGNVTVGSGAGIDLPVTTDAVVLTTRRTPLSAHQKFREATVVVNQLASLVSESPMRHYKHRMKQLQKLLEAWKTDKETCIQLLDGEEGEGQIPHDESDGEAIAEIVEPASYGNDLTEAGVPYGLPEDEGNGEAITGIVEQESYGNDLTEAGVPYGLPEDEGNGEAITEIVEPESYGIDERDMCMLIPANDLGDTGDTNCMPLREVQLPPKTCKRGRPKGADKTVIGLKKRVCKRGKLVAYKRLSVKEKERKLLSWLLPEDVTQTISHGHLIDEHVVAPHLANLSAALFDNDVHLVLVQRFFTNSAWEAVSVAVSRFKEHLQYLCTVCQLAINDSSSICCDCCLLWTHLTCAGLKKIPSTKNWFCIACREKNE